MGLRDRINFLESQEIRHTIAIRTLEQETANLSTQLVEMNQRLEQAEGRVIIVEETPSPVIPTANRVVFSPPEMSHFQTNRSDGTGFIIHNSFDESIRGITANGDPDLQAILVALRNRAFGDLIKWRPTNPMIKSSRGKIIRWILHPGNVHKFRNKKAVETTSKNSSVWWGLVTDVFPELQNNNSLQKRIISILALAAKSSDTHFGSFVASVIKAHNECCTVMHV